MTDSVRAWLSLGSNIERERYIRQALDDLRSAFGELVVSPIYESPPVGSTGDNFFNLVVGIVTRLPVVELAARLRRIEENNGRLRGDDKHAPRTLDIDLLTYADRIVEQDGIHLPRDEITRYAFVLLPLSEVAAEEIHPLSGLSYRDMWSRFDDPSQKLWRVKDMAWRHAEKAT